ncbi:MAG: UDP-N-acetylenolpyruvoylglucosamine reductase [Clostridiales bacterium]|nr:UDP-N-acetylenolpyruvoylglucosamine reductase [Clostridiales bacterium]
MDIISALHTAAPGMTVEENIPFASMTTLKVGGPARYLAQIRSADDAKAVQRCAAENGLSTLVVGNGSNLLVSDEGFDGIVLLMKNSDFSGISLWDDVLCCQAGASMAALARTAAENGLTGLETVSGIPGTAGGGIYMNAGAYGGQISDHITSVTLLRNGEIVAYSKEEMDFSYRHSRAMTEDLLVLGAEFTLEKGDPDAIFAAMKDYNGRRREKQPLEYPSAGSFFKRPDGFYAGALIEQSGLKGTAVGGAQVSEKHAGFLINRGGATAKDFIDLMHLVQKTVFDKFGVRLENEVRIIGGGEQV